jgi:hypothetical protein
MAIGLRGIMRNDKSGIRIASMRIVGPTSEQDGMINEAGLMTDAVADGMKNGKLAGQKISGNPVGGETISVPAGPMISATRVRISARAGEKQIQIQMQV